MSCVVYKSVTSVHRIGSAFVLTSGILQSESFQDQGIFLGESFLDHLLEQKLAYYQVFQESCIRPKLNLLPHLKKDSIKLIQW